MSRLNPPGMLREITDSCSVGEPETVESRIALKLKWSKDKWKILMGRHMKGLLHLDDTSRKFGLTVTFCLPQCSSEETLTSSRLT